MFDKTEAEVDQSVTVRFDSIPGATGVLDNAVRIADRVLGRDSPTIKELEAAIPKVEAMICSVASQMAPCKKGCSHCCNMAVTITQGEAHVIAKAYGIPVRRPPPAIDQTAEVSKYMNKPCPFKVRGECSIYDHRPAPCRTHFNISAYPEVCDTVNNPGRNVPTLGAFKALWFMQSYAAMLRGEYPADIREFFPDGKQTTVICR